MSRKIVENYFMRVGRSYYRSPEFDAERARLKAKGIELEATSQFGIGILSCFMVADRFEVETLRAGNHPNNRPLRIAIEGPTKYFVIQLLNPPPTTPFPLKPASDHDAGPPHHPGTRLIIHLRRGTKLDVFQTLDTFAVNVDYDIAIYRAGPDRPVVISRRRWESREYVNGLLARVIERGRRYPLFPDDAEGLVDEISGDTFVAANLREIIVPSQIPFEEYEFSAHLRGRTWFWLLPDKDGGVCANRGYLSIDDTLRLHGLPQLLGYIAGNVRVDFELLGWSVFLEELKRSRKDEDESTQLGLLQLSAQGIFAETVHVEEEESEQKAQVFLNMWQSLSTDERNAACESLSVLDEDAMPWYEVDGLPQLLLTGDLNWSNRSITFYQSLAIRYWPRSFALHGILLPAGFVEWEPMKGMAKKLGWWNMASGIQVDMRGAGAPVPAASRLFVPFEEMEKAVLPVLRACTRHALKLATAKTESEAWDRWLYRFYQDLRQHRLMKELAQVEQNTLTAIVQLIRTTYGHYY